jgi:hypothetical protein
MAPRGAKPGVKLAKSNAVLILGYGREPEAPRDARTVAGMIPPRIVDALSALAAGREVGFPVKAQLRFLSLSNADCTELTPLGRAVLDLKEVR